MKDQSQRNCPRTEQLSALIDGELAEPARAELTMHAGGCPLCGAMLKDLSDLRVALRPLAAARPGFDLAPLIDQRLATRDKPRRPPARDRSLWHGWRIVPSGLAAAGVLTAGVYVGTLLAAGTGRAVVQPAAMAMFDPIPPGGLCIGSPSCFPPGR